MYGIKGGRVLYGVGGGNDLEGGKEEKRGPWNFCVMKAHVEAVWEGKAPWRG